jgi:sigma-B regulation protein RsbU (phosphoserine phosphatase)
VIHDRVEVSTDPVLQSEGTGDILIVDDTPINLRLLGQMLVEHGYQVRPVPDGAMALDAVHAKPPDLILLDILMPGMDGYEVCEQLKADAQTRDIPIIFISALDATEDKVKAFAIGGVDYITKPFQIEEVLARVETHLALRRLQKQLQDANRRMERELTLAGQVQASFLPRALPEIPGWQLAVALNPARETSGDFYDVNLLPNGCLGLLVADVVDKGVGAALFMALSWSLIRTYAAEYPMQPEAVLGAVNHSILKETSAHQFVTVFYGILDPVTGTLIYCNAGHSLPYLFRTQGRAEVQELEPTGTALGIYEDKAWVQKVVQLAPGDVLVLYTDGVTEARKGPGMLFGEERLLEAVRTSLVPSEAGEPSAQDVRDAVLAQVGQFVSGAPQSDDIALLVLVRETGLQ